MSIQPTAWSLFYMLIHKLQQYQDLKMVRQDNKLIATILVTWSPCYLMTGIFEYYRPVCKIHSGHVTKFAMISINFLNHDATLVEI